MPREYAQVTIYRGGTLDSPTDPYVIEDDIVEVTVDNTITIASVFEVRILNFKNVHTDAFYAGHIIEIDMGLRGNHDIVLRGLIFGVEHEEDFLRIVGKDWAQFMIGTRVTKEYGNIDYAAALRNLLEVYAPSLKYNFLIDTGYILQQLYAGGYNNLMTAFNEITGMVSYDWRVRTDREVVIMPDGLQIDFIDAFQEETELADPDGWTEQGGTWNVQSNRYRGEGGPATLAVTTSEAETTDYTDIRVIGEIDSTGSGDALLVIFDYVGGSDWKYLELDVSADTWVLGHYDGSFNVDDTTSNTVGADTDTKIRVVIDGNLVTAYEWDSTDEEWDSIVDFTYSSVGTGLIGVGGRFSTYVEFDDFVVYSAGLESIDVNNDCLSWSIKKRDFSDLVNKVTVIGGKEKIEDDFTYGSLWQWGNDYGTGNGTIAIVDEELEIEADSGYDVRQYTEGKYRNIDVETDIRTPPATDNESIDTSVTNIGDYAINNRLWNCSRNTFRNSRGLGKCYVFYTDGTNVEYAYADDPTTTWTAGTAAFTSTGTFENVQCTYVEDPGNSRTLVYVSAALLVSGTTYDIIIRSGSIADVSSTISWQTEQLVHDDVARGYMHGIQVDLNGYIWFWRTFFSTTYRMYVKCSTSALVLGSITFTSETELGARTSFYWQVAMVPYSSGILFIGLSQDTNATPWACYSAQASPPTDDGEIEGSALSSSSYWGMGHAVLDSDTIIHYTFTTGSSNHYYHSSYDPVGKTWGDITNIDVTSSGKMYAPALLLNDDVTPEELVVVYETGAGIISYKTSPTTSVEWSTAVEIVDWTEEGDMPVKVDFGPDPDNNDTFWGVYLGSDGSNTLRAFQVGSGLTPTTQASIILRAEDDTNFYRVRMNANGDTLDLVKVVSGTPTTIQSVAHTYTTGQTYVVKAKATDENFKVYIDGVNKIDVQDTTFLTGFVGLGAESSIAFFDNVTILSDRDVIASASDPTLIQQWGEKSSDPIRDDSIHTKGTALKRAQLELDRFRYEKTRGILKIEGDINIKEGDVTSLTAEEANIDDEDYRIVSVIHVIDDSEGYVTLLKVSEYFPGLEDVIRVTSISTTFLSWVGLKTKVDALSLSDTVYTLTGSVDLYSVPYYYFYFDEEDTWGYTFWDFGAWH